MIIGLTGGFGCGKSSALAFFAATGWKICNSDEICADLYAERDKRIVEQLRQRWQGKVFDPDGGINKKIIAEIVFNDNAELKWLCDILHPLIAQEAEKIIASNAGKDIIMEVPLLFEAKWEKMFDLTICVWTDAKTKQKRLLEKGFSVDEIEKRDSKQLADNVKLERADFGIFNTDNLEFLQKQCNELSKYIRSMK